MDFPVESINPIPPYTNHLLLNYPREWVIFQLALFSSLYLEEN